MTQPRKTASEWAKEVEIEIECYDGLDGGRASREETRKVIAQALESYLLQESGELVKSMTKLLKPIPEELRGWTREDLFNGAMDECETALNNFRSRHDG